MTRGDSDGEVLWRPNAGSAESGMARFTAWLEKRHGLSFPDYHALWQWSTTDLGQFWADIAEYFEVASGLTADEALAQEKMPGAIWFPGIRVNFAQRILDAFGPDEVAIIATDETGRISRLTGKELRRQVASFAATLRSLGVERGDRVAGYVPNTEHAVVAFLGTAAIGAIWTACAPDFGTQSVLDRFAQTSPRVLVAADGHHFGGRPRDRSDEALEILHGLPGSPACIWIDYLNRGHVPSGDFTPWAETVVLDAESVVESLPFDHPLWILYSSGTTGVPKGIVHGHGGMLLEQLKTFGLNSDLKRGDTFFWYTTTAWMMWNIVVSSMLVGATAVVYDGSPQYPDLDGQWALVERLGLTHFGTSAGYLSACATAGLRPKDSHDLTALRFIGSTGSPLPANTARWVYAAAHDDAQLVSSTGGTDMATGFFGGAPNLPVLAGELSGPMLGVAVDAWDDEGRPIRGREGELVVTRPMPTMPLYFWNDPDGIRYAGAYFSVFPGVWRHGDWVEITERGTAIVSGRSDSTLNRAGVRLGTADVYAAVLEIPGIVDALMLGIEQDDGGYWMPLFIEVADGVEVDDRFRGLVNTAIQERASRRHVPDDIIAVPGVPHTRTGKRLEVPIKRMFQGHDLQNVVSFGSVDDPASLEHFARLADERLKREKR